MVNGLFDEVHGTGKDAPIVQPCCRNLYGAGKWDTLSLLLSGREVLGLMLMGRDKEAHQSYSARRCGTRSHGGCREGASIALMYQLWLSRPSSNAELCMLRLLSLYQDEVLPIWSIPNII